jgi:predicted glycoside hydrolase/deacetylase ChbG (UPF0249 family)
MSSSHNLLLVNADDFGLHPEVNSAIYNCAIAGSVNSVSVMANGLAPDYDMLHQLIAQGIYTGAHISWVNETWLTQNLLIPNWRNLVIRTIAGGKKFRQELKAEAEAQIEILLKNNIPVLHIDSHQHVHHFMGLIDIFKELQQKYNIQRMRIAKVANPKLMRNNISGYVLNSIASHINNHTKFYCAGIKHAGNYNLPLLINELSYANGNNTELIVHPGQSNAQLNQRYAAWHFNWEQEYNALMDKNFIQAVTANGFVMPKAK